MVNRHLWSEGAALRRGSIAFGLGITLLAACASPSSPPTQTGAGGSAVAGAAGSAGASGTAGTAGATGTGGAMGLGGGSAAGGSPGAGGSSGMGGQGSTPTHVTIAAPVIQVDFDMQGRPTTEV